VFGRQRGGEACGMYFMDEGWKKRGQGEVERGGDALLLSLTIEKKKEECAFLQGGKRGGKARARGEWD